MYKMAVIGAGQLGSRHLQRLAKSKLNLSIEVIEPSVNSKTIAEKRFMEVLKYKNKSLKFCASIDKLSDEVDVAIVSTNLDVREKIVLELLTKKDVKYLILEKVLFQKENDYYDIEIFAKFPRK